MKWTGFYIAVAGSLGLHLVTVTGLVCSGRWIEQRTFQVASTDVALAQFDTPNPTEHLQTVGVSLEAPGASPASPAATPEQEGAPANQGLGVPVGRVEPKLLASHSEKAEPARLLTPTNSRPMAKTAPAQVARPDERGLESGADRIPSTPVPNSAPSVTPDALRSAMQAAATQASSANGSGYTVPSVRVDPNERNLDRAWARSFAWAFSTDRSFFGQPPLGTARFVLELAETGAIREVHWISPNTPSRLQALILRMVKLLSRNHFGTPSPESERPWLRGFEMKVNETRVSVPAQVAAAPGQAGDLWMLGAGEIPMPGRPSHPMVADMTGHQLDCVLRIVEPPPDLGR